MAIVRDIVRPVVRNIVYPVDSKYFNWSSWWSALISATIETAEPTHVVLTFPSAKVLVSTDITATVNGVARVVSSASWTGVVWTVVLDSAVTVFDSIIVTFVKTGQTQAVTNNVEADGNTVAWFPFDTDYIIKDGANRVIFGIAGEQEINSDQWKNEGGEDWKAVMKITKWITDVIVLPEDYKISMQFTRMFRKSENQEILEQLLSDIITNNLI